MDLENFYLKIPLEVLDDPRLSDSERVLYAWILKFCEEYGAYTKTDKFLAGIQKISLGCLKARLKKLEECGWIYRETQKDGMFWHRRILVNDFLEKGEAN
jgi:hypothetical protein